MSIAPATGAAPRTRRASALLVLAVTWSIPQAATADSDDRVDSWQMSCTVDSDGLLHVSETLVWRLGSSSGRHGIVRELVVRRPWGDDGKQDAVHEISGITVSSPDASAQFTTGTSGEREGERTQHLVVTIGDPAKRITAATATYTISYTVAGSLRTSGDHNELYWDALGPDTPQVDDLQVNVDMPGGAQQAVCFAGPTDSADARETTATIIDLAVRDVLQLRSDGGEIRARLVDPGLMREDYERRFVADRTTTLGLLKHAGMVGEIRTRRRRCRRRRGDGRLGPAVVPRFPAGPGSSSASNPARTALPVPGRQHHRAPGSRVPHRSQGGEQARPAHDAGQRTHRPGEGLPRVPRHSRGRPAPVRGGPGHFQPVPALGDRLRPDGPLGPDLRTVHRRRTHRADRSVLALRRPAGFNRVTFARSMAHVSRVSYARSSAGGGVGGTSRGSSFGGRGRAGRGGGGGARSW